MKGILLLLGLIPLTMYCTQQSEKKQEYVNSSEISTKLVGKWRTERMEVQFTSHRLTKKDSVLVLTSENYESVMKALPPVMEFKPDGSYVTLSYRPEKADTVEGFGNWQISNGKVVIDFRIVRNEYDIVFNDDNTASISGQVDIDNDLEKDDYYKGVIVRIEE